jgi:hypothetical protein
MGKIFENLIKIPQSQKSSNSLARGSNGKKVTLHVFICEILANMTPEGERYGPWTSCFTVLVIFVFLSKY